MLNLLKFIICVLFVGYTYFLAAAFSKDSSSRALFGRNFFPYEIQILVGVVLFLSLLTNIITLACLRG